MSKIKWEAFLAFSFFCAVGLFFSRPIFVVSDFWWHISNGKWIVEHLAFPRVDPFSLMPHVDSALREALVLKGYWLSQVLYFQVYSLMGMAGPVVLKAIVLTAIVCSVWRILVARGVQAPWSLLLLVPLVIYLREYDELRPHLFSFLCLTLLILSMGCYLEALRDTGRRGWRYALCLIMIMVLWANVHTGFILGNGFVLLCLAGEIVKYIRKKNHLSTENLKTFCSVGLVALLAPLLNPNGFLLYKVLLAEGIAGGFSETVSEYDPVWIYFSRLGDMPLFYGMLIILAFTIIVCLFNINKIELVDVLLLAVFSVAGFAQFRYSAFFVIIATLVVGRHLFAAPFFLRTKTLIVSRCLVVMSIVTCLTVSFPESAWSRGPLAVGSVARAAVFVKDYDLPAPLFSPYEWGGYLQWVLFPEYKVFVDARAINYSDYADYRDAVRGKKAKVFEKYKFNTVMFYLYAPSVNQIPSIIYSLLKDSSWDLLYVDTNAVIFSKKRINSTYGIIEKKKYVTFLKQEMKKKYDSNKTDDKPLLDLAQLCYVQSDIDGAHYYFKKALEVNADNEFAKSWLRYLDTARKR